MYINGYNQKFYNICVLSYRTNKGKIMCPRTPHKKDIHQVLT